MLPNQGSNLALANLLNASSFLQKASRNCHHLQFLACGKESLTYQQNDANSITCMANSVLFPDQPASSELADLDQHCLQGNLNIGSES